MKKLLKKTLPLVLCTAISPSFADITTTKTDGNHQTHLTITIYNNLALINDTRNISIKKGINSLILQDVSSLIRPESVILTNDNQPLNIIEQNFDYDLLNFESLLKKSVGETIELISTNSEGIQIRKTAKLLSYNDNTPVLQYEDKIEVGNFSHFSFTKIPDNLRVKPTLSVLIDSLNDEENSPIEMSYLSNGFSWSADYNALLNSDETELNLSSLITLNNNSGNSYKNAQINLIAGDVNTYEKPNLLSDEVFYDSKTAYKAKAPSRYIAKEEAFSDYHLYQLPFMSDLNDKQIKQVSLFNKTDIATTKEYRFEIPFEYMSQTDSFMNAEIYYHIDNQKNNNLGLPFPQGTFRLFKKDSNGKALLIGESKIAHTPENQTISVNSGKAFDITMNKSITDRQKISNGYSQSVSVLFKNAKDEPITINYIANRFAEKEWEITDSSLKNNRISEDAASWSVIIPAKGEATLTYNQNIREKKTSLFGF